MHSAIEDYIRDFQPRALLECSTAPWPELQLFCQQKDIAFSSLSPQEVLDSPTTPFDLAIVHHALEGLDPPQGRQVLGYLRNSLAQRVWLLLPSGTEWSLSALIALGFKRDRMPVLREETGLTSYTYDIGSYNHKRTWNNARFWANPENFDKYRW